MTVIERTDYLSEREALEQVRLSSDESESWKTESSCRAIASLRKAGWTIKRYRVKNGYLVMLEEPALNVG